MKQLLCFAAAMFFTPGLQAQTCTNASLNGKYSMSGQGDVFTTRIDLLGIVVIDSDATVSTTGYIVADGAGHLTAARLFEATNAGVSDTGILSNPGTYSITDCDNGTLSLVIGDRGSQTRTFNIDLDNVESATDPNPGLAHNAAALDADSGRDESLQLARTVDPAGANACGAGFTLAGVNTSGMERGHNDAGQPVSAAASLHFGPIVSGVGSLSGTEKVATPAGFTTTPYTGTYIINPDCTVTLTRTMAGITRQGAHIITGGDTGSLGTHAVVWQGDSIVYGGSELSGQIFDLRSF